MIKQQTLYKVINEYIDKEIAPLSNGANQLQQFLFGFQLGIIKRKSQAVIKDYLNSSAAKVLHIVEGDDVDVDTLYGALSESMEKQGNIEAFGIKFTSSDVNKLYSMLREQSYEQINTSNP